ncbi:hypothetical protein K437DRAFT_256118 [Tilletiaria anomala UBC 951]|uniref:Uncharacterized protein n=1 Tax=Tilletiaria anomala (strain ATCC 24038 / CBS 436.72 / UBC 951) TaxID=1037660 RepID=A0A066VXZ5_TILAU|nr:uncharacterized protein K437DRAFT_256118 [Tilletiaria anomala UBC 951]KDN46612.1 hypothetical protein K437DRAFT_256118 [Tilletiaria anomala UBC 951]
MRADRKPKPKPIQQQPIVNSLQHPIPQKQMQQLPPVHYRKANSQVPNKPRDWPPDTGTLDTEMGDG